MSVHWVVDDREVQFELRRLEHAADEAVLPLEAALATVFAAVRSGIHVYRGRPWVRNGIPDPPGGRLRDSAEQDSIRYGQTWRGTIEVGGEPAVRPPGVHYGRFEAERGGTHDFMEPARSRWADELYEAAILAVLAGR